MKLCLQLYTQHQAGLGSVGGLLPGIGDPVVAAELELALGGAEAGAGLGHAAPPHVRQRHHFRCGYSGVPVQLWTGVKYLCVILTWDSNGISRRGDSELIKLSFSAGNHRQQI